MSGRNISDISTVVEHIATAGAREGAGRPWLASPDVLANWHYALPGAGSAQSAGDLSWPAEYMVL